MEKNDERDVQEDEQLSRSQVTKYVIMYFLTFKGRMSRGVYWLSVIALAAIFFIIDAVLGFVGYDLKAAINEGTPAGTVVTIVWLWLMMAQTAKRMHDRGWVWPWMLFPIVNIILALGDGQPYDNRYGPDPKGRHEPEPEIPDISEFFG